MAFVLQCFLLGNMENACVVASDDNSKKLIMFDAPFGCGKVLKKKFPGYDLEALFLTHGHYDDILGVGELHDKAQQVLAHIADKTMYEHPEVMSSWLDPGEAAFLRPVKVTHYFDGDETVEVAGLQIEARHAPGHSQGGMVFYLPTLQAVIVGDDLFRESIGRTDLPGGSRAVLLKSIREKILTLPDDTCVYPGHGESTTVGYERSNNSFLQ